MNDSDALEIAASIAREAGKLILSSYRTKQTIDHKKNVVDLVTETDFASEALIRRRLMQHFPDFGIIAEEGEAIRPDSEIGTWIVDPLDGTVNFAHGHPIFCVSIALQCEDLLRAGVVHAPFLGLTWQACRGKGATRNGEPIRVSTTDAMINALCTSGFPYDRHSNEDDNLIEWGRMLKKAQGGRRCGSAAIDLCFIADGTYDANWEKRLAPWDMAAGALIVEEAGGRVTSIDGSPVPPWPEVIVATNGKLHDLLIETIS